MSQPRKKMYANHLEKKCYAYLSWLQYGLLRGTSTREIILGLTLPAERCKYKRCMYEKIHVRKNLYAYFVYYRKAFLSFLERLRKAIIERPYVSIKRGVLRDAFYLHSSLACVVSCD